jgi:hypothetical protein
MVRQLRHAIHRVAIVLKPLAAGHGGGAFIHSTAMLNRPKHSGWEKHGQ